MALGQFLRSGAVWALLAITTVAAVGWFFLPPNDAHPNKDPQVDGQVVYVQAISITREPECRVPIWYTGDVIARRQTQTGFMRGGMVTQILVDEGESVIAGQVIASQDRRQSSAQLKQLQADRSSVQAQLAELTKGPRQEAIRSAAANVDDLQQQQKRAGLDLKRYQRLLPQGAISKQEYEQALYLRRTIDARVDAAKAQLDELQVGTRIEKIDASRASLASVEAAIEQAKNTLSDCELTAPFSGTVMTRMADEGAVVDAGQPILQLIESDFLELHVGLPSSIATSLDESKTLDVEVDGTIVRGTFKSKVQTLDRATRTQKVILDLPDASKQGIVDRQLGRVKFERISKTPGFLLPIEAIVNDQQGLWSCYSVEQQNGQLIARRQSVEVLHFQGEQVFVRGTLSEGQSLIVDGLQRVTNGQIVKLKNDSSTGQPTEQGGE